MSSLNILGYVITSFSILGYFSHVNEPQFSQVDAMRNDYDYEYEFYDYSLSNPQ